MKMIPWEVIQCDDEYAQIYWPGGRSPTMALDKAERICACVNACQGIPTKDLLPLSRLNWNGLIARMNRARDAFAEHVSMVDKSTKQAKQVLAKIDAAIQSMKDYR
jgi:hypothetical protein